MKFPKTLFVRIDHGHSKDDECLIAQATEAAAIDDDGPTMVGVYAFVGVTEFAKQVVRVKRKKR